MSNISILAYLILTLAVGYSFIYPAIGDLTALLDEKQKYSDSLETVSNIESKKNELLTQFNNISAEDKKDIDTILPDSFNFVRLISQIDSVAAKYGISIDKITSKELFSDAGFAAEGTEPQKIYNSAIIGFSFTSSYDNFNLFMADLERSQRMLDIQSAKLVTGQNGVNSYDIEFETYWLKPL